MRVMRVIANAFIFSVLFPVHLQPTLPQLSLPLATEPLFPNGHNYLFSKFKNGTNNDFRTVRIFGLNVVSWP